MKNLILYHNPHDKIKFNERENLKTFVETVVEVMVSSNMSWELIIVDDGSKDNSREIRKWRERKLDGEMHIFKKEKTLRERTKEYQT